MGVPGDENEQDWALPRPSFLVILSILYNIFYSLEVSCCSLLLYTEHENNLVTGDPFVNMPLGITKLLTRKVLPLLNIHVHLILKHDAIPSFLRIALGMSVCVHVRLYLCIAYIAASPCK